MKIRKFKGFTLVELIIVMAITSILLVSIAAIFKPIGMLFQDASAYDTQRTIAEEINSYVCESVRYADNVYVYDKYDSLPVSGISYIDPTAGLSTGSAVKAFCSPLGKNESDVHIIYIINKHTAVTFPEDKINGINYTGRIYRSKNGETTTPPYYEALGKWFYGKNNFKFEVTSTAANNISIKTTVNTDQLTADGACTLLNTTLSTAPVPTSPGENTYILFTLPG